MYYVIKRMVVDENVRTTMLGSKDLRPTQKGFALFICLTNKGYYNFYIQV